VAGCRERILGTASTVRPLPSPAEKKEVKYPGIYRYFYPRRRPFGIVQEKKVQTPATSRKLLAVFMHMRSFPVGRSSWRMARPGWCSFSQDNLYSCSLFRAKTPSAIGLQPSAISRQLSADSRRAKSFAWVGRQPHARPRILSRARWKSDGCSPRECARRYPGPGTPGPRGVTVRLPPQTETAPAPAT
jgi:hypothetical protein